MQSLTPLVASALAFSALFALGASAGGGPVGLLLWRWAAIAGVGASIGWLLLGRSAPRSVRWVMLAAWLAALAPLVAMPMEELATYSRFETLDTVQRAKALTPFVSFAAALCLLVARRHTSSLVRDAALAGALLLTARCLRGGLVQLAVHTGTEASRSAWISPLAWTVLALDALVLIAVIVVAWQSRGRQHGGSSGRWSGVLLASLCVVAVSDIHLWAAPFAGHVRAAEAIVEHAFQPDPGGAELVPDAVLLVSRDGSRTALWQGRVVPLPAGEVWSPPPGGGHPAIVPDPRLTVARLRSVLELTRPSDLRLASVSPSPLPAVAAGYLPWLTQRRVGLRSTFVHREGRYSAEVFGPCPDIATLAADQRVGGLLRSETCLSGLQAAPRETPEPQRPAERPWADLPWPSWPPIVTSLVGLAVGMWRRRGPRRDPGCNPAASLRLATIIALTIAALSSGVAVGIATRDWVAATLVS